MYLLVLLVSFLVVGGCSGGEEESGPKTSGKDHVFKDSVKAIDKAKKVERMIQQKDDRLRKEIEKQTE